MKSEYKILLIALLLPILYKLFNWNGDKPGGIYNLMNDGDTPSVYQKVTFPNGDLYEG